MMNLFKSKTPNVQVVEKADLRGKSTNQIIEEIHDTFFTEVDRLLSTAKIANSLDTNKQGLIDKCTRLKALGFINTKEVKEAEVEISRLDKLKRENEEKKTLIEAINYFSFKYPNYKFITEESVKKICAKYNLIYGEIGRYTGTVPDKNLKHIEDFKVLEDDECYIEQESRYSSFDAERSVVSLKYKTLKEYNRDTTDGDYNHRKIIFSSHYQMIDMKCPLEIAAPLKDFNMNGMEVKGFKLSKIEIPDPVVLKPVIFNGQKHYLIVTAWGIEAGDELVVNPKHN